jgi:hypothetical protein
MHSRAKLSEKKDIRVIQEGLLLGKDWTDYRLPAAPQFFVGRKDLINEIITCTQNKGFSSNVIQIKSRSGVGKSSILRIPDYSDSISGSIRTIKPDTSGHLVMYFDFT